MDLHLTNRISSLMHSALARKLLNKYFTMKGVTAKDWDLPLNPQMVADLTKAIPEFYQKVEIIPYVAKLDPLTGATEIGWNIFVLGNKRMYLGITKHRSLGELISLSEPDMVDRNSLEKATTPRKVVDFICSQLKGSEEGRLEFFQPTALPQFMRRPNITAPYASYYEKRRWGR